MPQGGHGAQGGLLISKGQVGKRKTPKSLMEYHALVVLSVQFEHQRINIV